jgi:hypothetical protein
MVPLESFSSFCSSIILYHREGTLEIVLLRHCDAALTSQDICIVFVYCTQGTLYVLSTSINALRNPS